MELLWGLLTQHVSFGWEEESLANGETCFRIHCESKGFMEQLCHDIRQTAPQAKVHMKEVPQQDWTLAWRKFFTPIACGERFLVLPPWLVEDTDTEGRQAIVIEPKSAFGTGHHSTTALCLSAVSSLVAASRVTSGMEFFDIGTGTGILGLSCALSGLHGIGVDTDPLAVENALENRTLNAVLPYDAATHQGMDMVVGSVDMVQGRSFDLVLANILAEPLKEMASQIIACVKQGGCLILSGILTTQADSVEAAYTALGFPPARRMVEGEWTALVWD